MNVIDLIEKIVRDGVASVQAHERRPERLRGGVKGFEMCKTLLTSLDYERILRERHHRENAMRATMHEPAATYWEYRYATIQIEFVCEILKVHEHYDAFSKGLDHPPFSARALRRYQELVAN